MQDAEGCQFILDSPGKGACGAQTKTGSPYCIEHHAICYIPIASAAERRKLREFAITAHVCRRDENILREPSFLLRQSHAEA